jgi:hypothetical protein
VARAYIDVTPDMLPHVGILLPSGVNIIGALESYGAIRLVLEGQNVPEGKVLEGTTKVTSTKTKMEKVFSLKARPENG